MDVLKRLRIYAGSDPIVWPDITALRSWIKTRNWPDAYNITYQQLNQRDFKRDRVQAENDVLACALLYTTIPAQRLDRYWDEMDQLDKAVAGGEVREQEVTNEVLDDGFKLTALQNPAIDAMRYFGEKYWPEDFLLAFGNAHLCDGVGYNVGFYALPRALFILVAVIESRTKLLEISGM